MSPSRRTFLQAASGLFITPSAANDSTTSDHTSRSNQPRWRHGLSLFGDLKYAPHFSHFDYVNPRAPKAGAVRQSVSGTFDNFNMVVEGRKGVLVAGIDLIYDTLLTLSLDEVSSAYGLLAEAISHPADFSSVTYRLRPPAKWHDGLPITPEDVVFSFNAFKKYSPRLAGYYRHVMSAQITGQQDVMFYFDTAGIRELPQIVGQLTVLPKHWWDAADGSGKRRRIADTMLEVPLGSGPYRVRSFDVGRSIMYQRVGDYWGKDLNVRSGQGNFDELRDTAVEFEAFKAGLSTGALRT